jgi:quercetin dioxygenase-like cupin family protein
MTRSGDIIDNLRGEKLIFRQTAADTDNARVEFDIVLEPGAGESGHMHPAIAEKFEVIFGIVRFTVAGYPFTAIAGEKFTIPADEWHGFENVGAKEARLRVTVEPAAKMESLYKSLFALAHSGEINLQTGMPDILQIAVLLNEFRDELYTPQALRLPVRIAALVGRVLGYQAYHMYPFVRSTGEVERIATANF